MIADGYAFEYTCDLPYRYQADFKAAENDAEPRRVGCGRRTPAQRDGGMPTDWSSALLMVLRVSCEIILTPYLNGNGTESGSIVCTSGRVAVPQCQCVCNTPAISAIENAMRRHDYYYKLCVRR